ncbi:MAG TPA: outer membrane protein assembly factor BamB [Ramlibacter sp.]|nr:outer membrane protein assembly factor BamB [Ramlibacter sp.]
MRPAHTARASWARCLAVALMAGGLAGCSILPSWFGGPSEKPKPAPLAANPARMAVKQAWTARIGSVDLPLSVGVAADRIALASSDGTVVALESATGRELWRASAGAPLSAGVGTGSDGALVAVVTRQSEVVVLSEGKQLWREKIGAQGYTAPFVAGGRVFVLAADRSVTAFDGRSGRKLWTQQRPGEPLVLRQSGVMLAVGDTLVVGQAGRLAGLNPANGSIRWEAPVATPRGTNDVERLVDLVGPVSRLGDTVCARAFQASVGCINAGQGTVLWTRPANGAEGLHGDETLLLGTEADGKVVAWRRNGGERAWMTDRLLHRGLTAPLVVGRAVMVGDNTGLVHVLSRDDGSLLNRLETDGSPAVAAPVLAGNTVVVVTRNGGVYGFIPQ